ncbi:MAG TPA: prolyl oligopeptidase family serine peptidase [Candidatus Binataceae bacterium]|nr:prolyl oligopeptidase family serine peptidase [Candidatus Binataceae bacterium]
MDTKTAASAGSDADPLSRWSLRRGATAALALIAIAATLPACRVSSSSFLKNHRATVPFNFAVALGPNQYQIAGYLTRSPGRHPAVLVLNGEETAERCVDSNAYIVAMGIQVACVSIPGYGHSSGPSRYVGPQAVAAARRALDLLAARPDVDPTRIAVWGRGNGAVAAGLLMDYDSRPRALILQSGAYDMLSLWPETTLRTKLAIMHEVWPSKRVLAERSVIRHLPNRLGCSVLILHGEGDKATPVSQAEDLASALRERGARVETHYFPQGHRLGSRVSPDLRAFLQKNLLEGSSNATS